MRGHTGGIATALALLSVPGPRGRAQVLKREDLCQMGDEGPKGKARALETLPLVPAKPNPLAKTKSNPVGQLCVVT
jgi:hypothetical protein